MSAQPVMKAQGGPAMVEGEFLFTEGDFRKIAAMVHGDAGIALPETKATLVYSRLAKRLRALGIQSFQDYCALVATADGVDERQKMLAALTTNVTRFFREPHHFDHLRDQLLPKLLAACSSGQEPYSIAMTALAMAPDLANLDFRILATDIDPNVVREAREAVYSDSLLAGMPEEHRRRWTTVVPGRPGYSRIAEEARALITFNELNLIADWPMKGRFDAIFCRNVAIYFDDDTQARLWSRFAGLLPLEGRLYIGHSERVAGPAAQNFTPDGITTYRLTSMPRAGEVAR
jgi:chemotaxis protein methyltransferase CheR